METEKIAMFAALAEEKWKAFEEKVKRKEGCSLEAQNEIDQATKKFEEEVRKAYELMKSVPGFRLEIPTKEELKEKVAILPALTEEKWRAFEEKVKRKEGCSSEAQNEIDQATKKFAEEMTKAYELMKCVPGFRLEIPTKEELKERRQKVFEDAMFVRGGIDKEEYNAYRDLVLKSEGFEAFSTKYGSIRPMDITKRNIYSADYGMCARFAVKTYNSRFKDKLEFVKVLTVTSQPACVVIFYITFEAKDLADGGLVKTYQTKMLIGLPHVPDPWTVLSFRLKPSQDEQEGSGNCEATWFWKE